MNGEVLDETLLVQAWTAREMAYAPYSNFRVGAALLTASGQVYTGCNIENASFGATICAERVAVAKAVSSGEKLFKALAVVADGPSIPAPCGICRQFLAEFGQDLQLILANRQGQPKRVKLQELLPGAFTGEHLRC
jgi:cytidine deaminase